MPSLFSDRLSSLAGNAVGLCLIALMAGCASKNPLMEDPPPAAKAPAPTQSAAAPAAQPISQPAPAQAPAAQAPAAQPASAAAEPAKPAQEAAVGVQTTKEKRFLGFLSPYRP